MTPTMRVRELTAAERHALRRGLKAADGFTVRRCQVLLASADGAGPAAIGAVVGLSAQAVRNAIRAFQAVSRGQRVYHFRGDGPLWPRSLDRGLA